MATPQRFEQGHARHPSSDTRRGMRLASLLSQTTNTPLVAMPRRSTKGPLDEDISSVTTRSFPPSIPSLTNKLELYQPFNHQHQHHKPHYHPHQYPPTCPYEQHHLPPPYCLQSNRIQQRYERDQKVQEHGLCNSISHLSCDLPSTLQSPQLRSLHRS
jgi:hypothetical protein